MFGFRRLDYTVHQLTYRVRDLERRLSEMERCHACKHKAPNLGGISLRFFRRDRTTVAISWPLEIGRAHV